MGRGKIQDGKPKSEKSGLPISAETVEIKNSVDDFFIFLIINQKHIIEDNFQDSQLFFNFFSTIGISNGVLPYWCV